MKQNTKIIQYLFLFFCMLTITGMLLIDIARALPSIGMIGICLTAIGHLFLNKNSQTYSFKAYGSLMLCFAMLIPSYFYSSNLGYFLERLQIHIPYLLLPLSWALLPKLNFKQAQFCFVWFVLGIFSIAVHSLLYYFSHQNLVNDLYLHSQVMPTILSHHPTFSLMTAYASFIAWHLFNSKQFFFNPSFEKITWFIVGLTLFIFTHIFSVRIGLIVLYALLLVEIIKYGIHQGKLKAFIAFIVFLIAGTIVLYNSPTFKNKLINTSQDLAVISNQKSANNQSLASRVISYQNAIKICNESSWLWGCGLGDIQDLNTEIFKASFPDVSKPIIPHNQFLFLLAATGITGVLFFSIAFFYPIWLFRKRANPILYGIYILLILAFQVEPFLQSQIGVAFSIFFILMGIMLSSERDQSIIPIHE